MILLCQPAVYAVTVTTLQVSPTRVTAGSVVSVSGTSAAGAWVSIKGVDSAGNILYFNSVLSNSAGAYSDTFKAPNTTGTLKIIAGSGADVASANVKIYKSSNGSSDSGSGGSGNGPGSGSGSSVSTTRDGQITILSITVTASGNPVAAAVAANVVAALADQARKIEEAGQKVVVEIKIEDPADAKTVGLTIPRTSFDQLADNTSADLAVNTELASITFNARAVNAISNAAAGEIVVNITKVEPSDLSRKMQTQVGNRPVYDILVKAGETEISEFNSGTAQISIPYTPKPGEDKNAIFVYYIDSAGKLNPVRGQYDPSSKTVNFTVSYFLQYVVGYHGVHFNDVADTAWYKEAVEFIAARGLTNGTGNGSFGPNDKLTRGQYIVMMMKAYGIEPDANPTDNFADAGSTYYTNYLAAAKRMGIAGGVGGNRFAPNSEITRQEMFTLVYKTLKQLGELPPEKSEKALTSFGDADQIAPWAREAMTCFVNTGTISGKDNWLSPAATTSRAEMAQVLYSLLTN